MTIGAWIACILLSGLFIALGVFIYQDCISTKSKVITIIGIIVIIGVIFGFSFWKFNNTASGKRALTDERSDLRNGLNRIVNVYTANGDKLATYEGKIDLEMDQDYIKFDWNGKRYIYYNCFVETIADIP